MRLSHWKSAAFFFAALLLTLVVWLRLPLGNIASPWIDHGPFAVETEEETLIDKTRATPAHNDYAGAPDRTLVVRYWYPRGTPRAAPLIVYSHGFGGMRDDIEYLCAHLASRGFVVAAPAFPGTNVRAPGGANLADVLNQPGDQRFLIDHVLQRASVSGDVLAGRVDPERIGALGLSLGGLTTMLLTFDRHRLDPRIKAAASIVGFHSMLRRPFFEHHPVPFLEIAGTNDEVVPYASNGARVPLDVPGSLLMTLDGGTHSGSVELFRYLRFLSRVDSVACAFINRQLEHADSKADWSPIGTAEEGVVADTARDGCMRPATVAGMDPRRQQQLIRIGITAFFESQFAAAASERAAASSYLREQISLHDVTITAAR